MKLVDAQTLAIAQASFALGAATATINTFAVVDRRDDTGYYDCKFCLIAVAQKDGAGKITALAHRSGCAAKKALDAIEKAITMIGSLPR